MSTRRFTNILHAFTPQVKEAPDDIDFVKVDYQCLPNASVVRTDGVQMTDVFGIHFASLS